MAIIGRYRALKKMMDLDLYLSVYKTYDNPTNLMRCAMKTFAVYYKQKQPRGVKNKTSFVQIIKGVDEMEAWVAFYSNHNDSEVTHIHEVKVDQELKTQVEVIQYLKKTGQYQG